MLILALASVSAFQTGNNLQRTCMPVNHCISYVVGAVDAFDIATLATGVRLFCAPDNISQGQAADIFARYIEQHPERRHLAGADLVLAAMTDAFPCTERRKKKR
jgi:hypothetical protein